MEDLKMEFEKMKKEDLVNVCCEMEGVLIWLENIISKSKGFKKGRREQVLEVLQKEKRITVGQIGAQLGMTCRNVSSYLCYLRKEGVNIGTDSKGRKYIETELID
jgi:biotin operon repressor